MGNNAKVLVLGEVCSFCKKKGKKKALKFNVKKMNQTLYLFDYSHFCGRFLEQLLIINKLLV